MKSDISSFLKSKLKATKVLSQTLENSSGINIMYHSIWSATLPTHHLLPEVNASSPQETEDLNDASYAKYIRYLSPATVFRSKLPPPIADINTQLS